MVCQLLILSNSVDQWVECEIIFVFLLSFFLYKILSLPFNAFLRFQELINTSFFIFLDAVEKFMCENHWRDIVEPMMTIPLIWLTKKICWWNDSMFPWNGSTKPKHYTPSTWKSISKKPSSWFVLVSGIVHTKLF